MSIGRMNMFFRKLFIIEAALVSGKRLYIHGSFILGRDFTTAGCRFWKKYGILRANPRIRFGNLLKPVYPVRIFLLQLFTEAPYAEADRSRCLIGNPRRFHNEGIYKKGSLFFLSAPLQGPVTISDHGMTFPPDRC